MKKIISLIIILSITLTALCGCGNNNNNANMENNNHTESGGSTDSSGTEGNSSDNSNEANEPIDIHKFKEVKASPYTNNINIYRQEVLSRIQSLNPNDSFITNEEWKVISESKTINETKVKHFTSFVTMNSLYEQTHKYYYPVIFRDGALLVLWYTNESGQLFFKELYGDGVIKEKNGGNVHYVAAEMIISNKHDQAITYSQETGKIEILQFGKVINSFDQIPQNSVYCGYSKLEGYIFRKGSDVYSLKFTNNVPSLTCIAHFVKYVISADYCYDSEYWSQPIFQMLDDKIKVYVRLVNNLDYDDTMFLLPLKDEGGYNK